VPASSSRLVSVVEESGAMGVVVVVIRVPGHPSPLLVAPHFHPVSSRSWRWSWSSWASWALFMQSSPSLSPSSLSSSLSPSSLSPSSQSSSLSSSLSPLSSRFHPASSCSRRWFGVLLGSLSSPSSWASCGSCSHPRRCRPHSHSALFVFHPRSTPRAVACEAGCGWCRLGALGLVSVWLGVLGWVSRDVAEVGGAYLRMSPLWCLPASSPNSWIYSAPLTSRIDGEEGVSAGIARWGASSGVVHRYQ
jgi:hypothetical protein